MRLVGRVEERIMVRDERVEGGVEMLGRGWLQSRDKCTS